MGKVVKFIVWAIIAIILLIVIAGFVIAANLGGIIKKGVNDYGEQFIGVPVSVQDVNVSLMGGSISVKGLELANPQGFSESNMFSLASIELKVNPSLSNDKVIVIDHIRIDGADVLAEQNASGLNLQKLGGSSGTKNTHSSQEGQPSNSSAELPNIYIGEFSFTGTEAEVKSAQLGAQSVQIPNIQIAQIGSQTEGVTIKNATDRVVSEVKKVVIKEVQKQALDKVVEKEIDKQLDKALGEDGAAIKGALKGLFK